MLLDYCTACGSDDLDEYMNGDVVCNNCGHVENVDEDDETNQ